MDEKEFELIKKAVHNIHNARQAYRQGCEVESLDVVGLKLTNRCNLRCKHCYEWNNEGYHHSMDVSMQSEDMPYEVIEKCIEETKESKPTFYLWGGEPLIYGHIQKLLNRLADENYVVAICTNGHYVLKYLEELKRFGSNLEIVIALEGMEKENDIIRGPGSFNKVAEVIATLSKLKKEGLFKGKITVHTMISNENVFTIKEYIQLMKDWGVENLILCLPWYLSSKISRDMDKFYNEKFDWLSFNNLKEHSWHAFKYKIRPELYADVLAAVDIIQKQDWGFNVRLQPDIKNKNTIIEFLKGENAIEDKSKCCLSLYSRIDVLPSGFVTSCKHFPEFTVGDLNKERVVDVWRSQDMNRIRSIFKERMAPVCSKCNNLYLHGYNNKGKNNE